MLNVVALVGRLVADPELKTTQSGNSVCTFSIACDRSYTAKDEERKADFFTITAWRQTAEFICKYFQKGSLIAIEGSKCSGCHHQKRRIRFHFRKMGTEEVCHIRNLQT